MKRPTPHVAYLANPATIAQAYSSIRQQQIANRATVFPEIIRPNELNNYLPQLRDVEVFFSGWGMPRLTPEQLDRLPNLRAVFYAAGSVQGFARPLLERGVTVVSAWRANAVPVAEFALSQILLSMKGYFRNQREYRSAPGVKETPYRGPGNYGETVALLGVGAIGGLVIQLLRPFHLKFIVFDSFLNDTTAATWGVEKVSLTEAFERAFVVSNHLADKAETVGLLNGDLFRRMRPGATFINTGRGRTVCEADLLETFSQRPDLTALLDVTYPEPPSPDSPLFTLPNVQLSTHIAGSIHDEVRRLGDYCVEEFERYVEGEPLCHAVTLEMLAAMA